MRISRFNKGLEPVIQCPCNSMFVIVALFPLYSFGFQSLPWSGFLLEILNRSSSRNKRRFTLRMQRELNSWSWFRSARCQAKFLTSAKFLTYYCLSVILLLRAKKNKVWRLLFWCVLFKFKLLVRCQTPTTSYTTGITITIKKCWT